MLARFQFSAWQQIEKIKCVVKSSAVCIFYLATNFRKKQSVHTTDISTIGMGLLRVYLAADMILNTPCIKMIPKQAGMWIVFNKCV